MVLYFMMPQCLKGNKTYDTWQEGLTSIFEAVLQNKPFILNVYHTTTQDSIERFLFTTVHDLILGVVREKCTRNQYYRRTNSIHR